MVETVHRKRVVGTALLAVTLAVSSAACGDDNSDVSAAAQEPGANSSAVASEAPVSTSSTSDAATGPEGGIASATYLPEGYEPTTTEESAPGVTSKRYRYPASDSEPSRVIIVRTMVEVLPDDVPRLLEGAAEQVDVGGHSASLFLPPAEMQGDGIMLRWVTPDNTMYEVISRGVLDDATGEVVRIAEGLSFDQQ